MSGLSGLIPKEDINCSDLHEGSILEDSVLDESDDSEEKIDTHSDSYFLNQFGTDRKFYLNRLFPETDWNIDVDTETIVSYTNDLLVLMNEYKERMGKDESYNSEISELAWVCTVLNYPLIKYILNSYNTFSYYSPSERGDILSQTLDLTREAFEKIEISRLPYSTFIWRCIKFAIYDYNNNRFRRRDSCKKDRKKDRGRLLINLPSYIVSSSKYLSLFVQKNLREDYKTLVPEEMILHYLFPEKFWKYEETRNLGKEVVGIKEFLTKDEIEEYEKKLSYYKLVEMVEDILDTDNTGIERNSTDRLERAFFFDAERKRFEDYVKLCMRECCTDAEIQALELRYGLVDGKGHSVSEISNYILFVAHQNIYHRLNSAYKKIALKMQEKGWTEEDTVNKLRIFENLSSEEVNF